MALFTQKVGSKINNELKSSHQYVVCYSTTKTSHLKWIISLIAVALFFYISFVFHRLQFSGSTSYHSKIPHQAVMSDSKESHSWNKSLGYCGGAPCYKTRSSVDLEFGSTVQFILTMGLEGTGHHWMGTIVEHSPALKRLTKYRVWPNLAAPMQPLLFHNYTLADSRPATGLFNAHCASEYNDNDVSMLRKSLVAQMQKIEAQAKNVLKRQRWNRDTTTIPFPVNTLQIVHGHFGEVSYPNYDGECRPLNYPDLNLFYEACHQAQVDCLQVYIYRHPVEILNSVVSRGYAPSDASSVQLYIANLHVLASQLRNHASKTLGCFGFFESDDEEKGTWKEAQLDLWDWGKDANDYSNFLNENYKAPSSSKMSLNAVELESWLNNGEAGPYLKSWWKLHNHVIATCRRVVMGA